MTDDFRDDFTGQIDELLKQSTKAFARWLAQGWRMTADEAMTLTTPTDQPQAFSDGWNAAMESLEGAADLWVDEIQ